MAAATNIPIASLEPGVDADSTSITGIVTLIWPYASSSQTLSLLLVEPDFRLRRNHGQVRVYFTGASAKALAKAHIASGDQVLLYIRGAKWTKDGPTTSTPGKGIEWELRYGERAVLQIQREGQQPLSLDVDHPAPSPAAPTQTPTPRLSPPYNSHIPTTIQKRQLDAQAWASPAFLKRSSQLAASAYDPFADDEFPDNDRKKRTKFGRGSDQWRFTDRTPSPEKEPEIDEFDSTSPSKLPAQHRKVEKEVTSPMEAVQAIEAEVVNGSGHEAALTATKNDDQTASSVPPSPLGRNVEKTQIEPGVRQAAQGVDTQATDGSAFEATVTDTKDDEKAAGSIPPSPPRQNTEKTQIESGVKQAAQESPAVFVESIVSSSASSSSRLDGPESDSQDDERSQRGLRDGLALSAHTSEFGMDGSVFSRTSQAKASSEEETREPAYLMEVDNAFRELSERDTSSPRASESILTNEEVGEQQAVISESANGFLLPDGDDSQPISTLYQQAAQLRSSPMFSSSEQLESEHVPEVESISSRETSDEEEQQVEIAEIPRIEDEERSVSPEGVVEQKSPSDMETDSEAEMSDEEEPTTPVQIKEQEEDKSASEDKPVVQSRQSPLNQNEKTMYDIREPETRHAETMKSTVEIIDLESESDEGSDQKDPNRPPQPIEESPGSSPRIEQQPMGTTTRMEEDYIDETFIDGRTSPKSHKEEAIDEQVGELPQLGKDVEEAVAENTSLTPREREPGATEVHGQQLSKAEKPPEATPVEVLPSTVAETFVEPSSKSQLMTPDDTQRSSFVSQVSFTSLQSEHDDNTLPTPKLTQGNSNGIVPPESPITQPSQEIEMKESSPVQEETLTIRKTLSTPRKVEEELPEPEKKVPTTQRPPTFIEKLKAMRKLSAQSPRRVSDSSATSPWFASKKPSQVVPDSEAETEAESSPEREKQFANEKSLSVVQTPEKPKALATSFIRTPSQSTPQKDAIASMQSSPGYPSPSQPPPPGFRTNISYYFPLTTLTSHFGTTVDVLSIVLSSTLVTRATAGPKDYNQTIYITDPAAWRQSADTPVITVQIFRARNNCFPITEKGDAILLRDFKVQTFQRHAMLLSTQSSAWAVFRRTSPLDIQIRGPPVELGPEERMFAQGLWRWRDNTTQLEKDMLDEKVPKGPPVLQNGTKSKAKKPPGRPAAKAKEANNTETTETKIKQEGIEGLGVNLPGSHNSPAKTRKAAARERSAEADCIKESTEPPQRVLRPRGARGLPQKSESPTKAIMRRSGTVFTGGLGEPDE